MKETLLTLSSRLTWDTLALTGQRIQKSIVNRPFSSSAALEKKVSNLSYELDESGLIRDEASPTPGSFPRLRQAAASVYEAILTLIPGKENKEKPFRKYKTNAPHVDDKSLRWVFKGKKNPKYKETQVSPIHVTDHIVSSPTESRTEVRYSDDPLENRYFMSMLSLVALSSWLAEEFGFWSVLSGILWLFLVDPPAKHRVIEGGFSPLVSTSSIAPREAPSEAKWILPPEKTNLKLLPNLRKQRHTRGVVFSKLREFFGISWQTGSSMELWGWRNRKQNKYLVSQYTRLMNLRGVASNKLLPFINYDGSLNHKAVKRPKINQGYWNLAYFLLKHSVVFRTVYFNHSFGRWEKSMPFRKVLDILYAVESKMRAGGWTNLSLTRVWIDGGKRPLGVPSSSDRVIGAQLSALLEFYLKGTFQHNHAYQFQKGTGTAWESLLTDFLQVEGKPGGLPMLYEYDIVGFFNNLDHTKILEALRVVGCPSWLWLSLLRLQQKAPAQSAASKAAEEAKRDALFKSDHQPLNGKGDVIKIRKSNTGGPPGHLRVDSSPINNKFFTYIGPYNLKGVAQGHNLSPLLSILVLDLALQQYKAKCKYEGYKVSICQYADDGIIGGTHTKIIDWWGPILKETTGCDIAKEKSHIVRENFAWKRPLKFLGLQYNPYVNKLYAATRKGSKIALDRSVSQFWGTWKSLTVQAFFTGKGKDLGRTLLKTEEDNIYYMYEPEYLGDKRTVEIKSMILPQHSSETQVSYHVFTRMGDGKYRRSGLYELFKEGNLLDLSHYLLGGQVITQAITWRTVLRAHKLNAFMARLYYGSMADYRPKQDFTLDPRATSLIDWIVRALWIKDDPAITYPRNPVQSALPPYPGEVQSTSPASLQEPTLSAPSPSDLLAADLSELAGSELPKQIPDEKGVIWGNNMSPDLDPSLFTPDGACSEDHPDDPYHPPTPSSNPKATSPWNLEACASGLYEAPPGTLGKTWDPKITPAHLSWWGAYIKTKMAGEPALKHLTKDLASHIVVDKKTGEETLITDDTTELNTFNVSSVGTYLLPGLLRQMRREGQSHWNNWAPLPKGIGPRGLHNQLLASLHLEGYWCPSFASEPDPHCFPWDPRGDKVFGKHPPTKLRKIKTTARLASQVDWGSAFQDYRNQNLTGDRIRTLWHWATGEVMKASRNYAIYRPLLTLLRDETPWPKKSLSPFNYGVMWGWVPQRPKRTHPDGPPRQNPLSMSKHAFFGNDKIAGSTIYALRWLAGGAQPLNYLGHHKHKANAPVPTYNMADTMESRREEAQLLAEFQAMQAAEKAKISKLAAKANAKSPPKRKVLTRSKRAKA